MLDWELSTLGDPLADFVYHLLMYRMPAGMFTGLAGLDLAALGIPSEDDYVAAYCRRTGRDHLPDLDYLMVFVMFRLAGILHGIKGRAGARQRQLGPCRGDGRRSSNRSPTSPGAGARGAAD